MQSHWETLDENNDPDLNKLYLQIAKFIPGFERMSLDVGISDKEREIMQVDPVKNMDQITEGIRDLSRDQSFRVLCGLAIRHPNAIETLLTRVEPLKLDFFQSIILALFAKRPALIEGFVEKHLSEDRFREMELSRGFVLACAMDDIEAINIFIQRSADNEQEMIKYNNYEAFREAAGNGKIATMTMLSERFQDKKIAMIATERTRSIRSTLREDSDSTAYSALSHAAANGQIDIINWIVSQLSPNKDELEQLIESGNCAAFLGAAKNGHLDVIRRLIELSPRSERIMETEFPNIVSNAAAGGQLDILKWVMPENFLSMLKSIEKYEERVKAIILGHFPVKSKETLEKIDLVNAFHQAANNGHTHVLEWLKTAIYDGNLDGNLFGEFQFNSPLSDVAKNGQLHVIDWFVNELPPKRIQQMIADSNYAAFCSAAEHGHLNVIEKLIALSPESMGDMIRSSGRPYSNEASYAAFYRAAKNGHLHVVKRLLDLVPPNELDNMLTASVYEDSSYNRCGNYGAFIIADKYGHDNITRYLLSLPTIFAYVEQHEHEYGDKHTHPFITQQLQSLTAQKIALEANDENAVFDVDVDKAKLCFYMLRNLIRRNDPNLSDDIRLLLEIPRVKALAHTAVTSTSQSNELIRLAITTGNAVAAEILLGIPAVLELTEQHNFYSNECVGHFDLRVVAQDGESSMRALSTGEQKRLQTAIKYYRPLIEKIGIVPIMSNLRDQLASRYADHPALLTRSNGEQVILPLNWNDFQQLKLNIEERSLALTAYYQHKDHAAYRYLSKPNHWMNDHASYVNVNPDNHAERWSTFEEYQPIIAMLYLASKDKEYLPTDGYTLETRLEHFIEELAQIGRAHNWDSTRVNDRGDTEEYDDLNGDRPSCFSGVKRRLFQSVLGHPLFNILTLENIKQALREFVRDYFKQQITEDNREELARAWRKLCNDGTCESCWDALNVSHEAQYGFISQLEKKYATQFTDEVAYVSFVRNSFTFSSVYPNHVVRFSGETNFASLLPEQLIDAEEITDIETCVDLPDSSEKAIIDDTLKNVLQTCGPLGKALLNEIEILNRVRGCVWPIWSGSEQKLCAIIAACGSYTTITDVALREALEYKQSLLSIALNSSPTADKTFRVKIDEALAKIKNDEALTPLCQDSCHL